MMWVSEEDRELNKIYTPMVAKIVSSLDRGEVGNDNSGPALWNSQA